MKKCLLLTSLLVVLCFSSLMAIGNRHTIIVAEDTADTNEYSLLMSFKGHEISGICIIKNLTNNNAVGTIINEFGIKAFDFSYYHGKVKLSNVIKPLNKWYIRKVLKKDFSFILENLRSDRDVNTKKRSITRLHNGEINIINKKYNIQYTLTPMNNKL